VSEDDRTTAEVKPLTEVQIIEAGLEILKDSEVRLGHLGDVLHELRRQVAAQRARLEQTLAALKAAPR
jgi:hypothetical protein